MAHHASAKKAIRQTAKHNSANKSRSSEIKTYIKKVEAAIEIKDFNAAQAAFKIAQAKIMRGAQKNILKPNTASRKVSRLALKVKALESVAA